MTDVATLDQAVRVTINRHPFNKGDALALAGWTQDPDELRQYFESLAVLGYEPLLITAIRQEYRMLQIGPFL